MSEIAQIITSSTDIAAVQTQANLIPASATSAVSPTTFVFWAGFDGTNNIAGDPAYSGDAQSTAVGALFDQIREANATNVGVGYYPGVGTPGTDLWSSVFPTNQAIATATNAYNDFAAAAAGWLQDNPGGSVTAMLATFSRGSIAGAVFSQMLYEKGLVYLDPTTNISTILVPPGQVGISAGLILSPVDTLG